MANCIDCGKEVDYRQKRCRGCYDKNRERKQTCLYCSALFKASPSQDRKYCSKKCEGLARSGKKNSFYGKHHTEETKKLISQATTGHKVNPATHRYFKKGETAGEKNNFWKGDEVGYAALHSWVRRHKPKPNVCECCKEKLPFDLANISGQYKRDVNDYEWVCRKCHMTKDKRNILVLSNLKQFRK